jgi:hypothetical protein
MLVPSQFTQEAATPEEAGQLHTAVAGARTASGATGRLQQVHFN